MPRPAPTPEGVSDSDNLARQRNRTLLVLFGGVMLGALDISIVGPSLPAVGETFGLDARQLSWVFTIYVLFGLIGAPLLAALSDRRGRRPIFMACLAGFGIGSLAVALAPSFPAMLVGRAVQAFAAGGTLPVASAVIADSFPEERRGRALGLIGAVFGVAFVVGPLIGGLLLHWSWRLLFLVNLPLIFVLLPAAARTIGESKLGEPTRFDWRGATTLALGLTAMAWAVSGTGVAEDAAVSGRVTLAVAGAVALVAFWGFWLAEHRAPDPILHPELLQSRQLRVVGVLALATGLVEASMIYLPALSVAAFGVSASTASFMLVPLVLALIAGSVIAGRALDRIGAKPVIQAGMTLIVVGLLTFALLPLTPASFYAAGLAIGLGLSSLLGAPLRFVALKEGGEGRRGASQGLLTVFLSSGRMFGAALIGGIAASGSVTADGYRQAMMAIAVGCFMSLLLSATLRGRTPA